MKRRKTIYFFIIPGVMQPEFIIPYIVVPIVYILTFLSKEYTCYELDKSNNGSKWQPMDVFLIVTMCYVGCPILAYFLTGISAMFGVNEWILKGVISASCMPPPLASGIVLCLMHNSYKSRSVLISNMNQMTYLTPGIIANNGLYDPVYDINSSKIMLAAIASIVAVFLGCTITPLLLFAFLGIAALPMIVPCIMSTIVAIISLLIGHILRTRCWISFKFSLPIGQLAILLSLYCSLCDVFIDVGSTLQAMEVMQSLMLVFLLQFGLVGLSYLICKAKPMQHLVAPLIFCGTHKSISLGFPLMVVMYGGLSHHTLISLPMLLYHGTQTFIGAVLINSGVIKY